MEMPDTITLTAAQLEAAALAAEKWDGDSECDMEWRDGCGGL